jgi:hypothetical protein
MYESHAPDGVLPWQPHLSAADLTALGSTKDYLEEVALPSRRCARPPQRAAGAAQRRACLAEPEETSPPHGWHDHLGQILIE